MSRPLSKKAAAKVLRRVAAHIKRWPHLFNYWASDIPQKGERGCVLGRAGALMGMQNGSYLGDVARRLRCSDAAAVYDYLRGATGHTNLGRVPHDVMARAVRELADEVAW